jgi:tRNA (cytidine56-2'-O)-methyltransferase
MIKVLRLGHRPDRDKRITTHVGLVARAFNAGQMLVDTKDTELEGTLQGVVDRFGGAFSVKTGVNWRSIIRNWSGTIIHLTMYGTLIDEVLGKLPREPEANLLIIVGATKVPREIYDRADFNIAIGNQPHSEVAALAIFLDRYFEGSELKKDFGGQLQIIGMPKGKKVVETENSEGRKK